MTGWQDDQERRTSRLPMALSVVAIVAAVATVVVLALVNRSSGDEPADVAVVSTTAARPSSPTSRPPTRTSGPTRTSTQAPGPGRVIDNPAAHLTYRVPAGWLVDESAKPTVSGVDFSGTAAYGTYNCGGTGYNRAFITSATAQNPTDKDLTPEKAATTFTSAFGRTYFPGAAVAAPEVRPVEVDGKKGVLAIAKVAGKPADAACASSEGEVAVLAIDLDNATTTRPRGYALLVIAADLVGGPTTPAPLTKAAVESILSTARLR
ncbi:hypothetical protein [Actinokineospora diospyrosa]|uniref:DUF8017 domain-containing protein n=1 Tax=Actinokineospora diospyrosa TaxID=103728 RepID=A0ABT1IDA0_9PSEU|nr:hypothetical protein [Actinokineospora diospyrosa]MCP2270613.1 hypothetical protein [Actinokineospora diospyrosa]